MSDEPRIEIEPSPVTAPPAAKCRRGWLLWLAVAPLLLLVGIISGALYYSRSAECHERMRRVVIAQMEQATGGRVELQGVDWSLLHLKIELNGLTIHGREGLGELPLLQVKQLEAGVRWLLPGHHASLSELSIVRPMAHIVVFRDGTTNLPESRAKGGAQGATQLIKVAIRHAEVRDGELLWNDRRFKLDGDAEQCNIALRWNGADKHYEGALQVGELRLALPQSGVVKLRAASDFRIYSGRIEVPRLRVSSDHSWIEASGAVTELNAPAAQFAYRSNWDLREVGQLSRRKELTAGTLQLSGEGAYDFARATYALVGKAQAAGVSWTDRNFRLERANGGFAYTMDRERLNVNSIFATALGGSAHGKMDVSMPSGKEASGAIDLEVNGIEVEQVLQAFSTRALPLSALHLAGKTAGKLDVRWHGSLEKATMEADLQAAPVRRAGALPVSVETKATIEFVGPSAVIHSAEISTPQTHLSAQGRIAMDSDLRLELLTADLHELQPMVTTWRGDRASDLPIEFAGRAHFRGAVQGRLGRPQIAGSLELHDFTTLLRRHEKQPDGATAERVVRAHWDLLQGDVEYSPLRESLHNGLLVRGNARIAVDATVPLVNGSYDGTQPFAAHVQLHDADASDIQAMAGSSYPITGVINGEVQVQGTQCHLGGSGKLTLHDGSAWQQAVRAATADVSFTENQAQLRNILVKSDVMQLTGDARINVETSEFGFNLKGTELRIENLRALRDSPIHATGQASFEANGSGTPGAPVVNGRLRLRNLALNRQPLGDLNIDAVTHGSEMVLTARSNFKGAEFKMDGQIYLRDAMPMHLSGDIASTNLNPWLQTYLPLRYGAASEMKLHFDAAGEARHLKDVTAEVDVQRWAINYAGAGVANDGPIRLKLANQVLSVEQFRISGEQGARFLQVRGQVELGGKRQIDLRADGSINLKLLETADPNLMATGVANLNLQMNGTLQRPSMRGRLNVQNGAIAYIDFPNGLSDINGSLVFNEDRLQVQEATARTGGGLLHCGGFLTFSSQQGMSFNLSASGHDIRLRYPEGLSSTADAAFQLTGTLRNAVLSGNVTVTRLGVNPQFDFATYLAAGIHGAPAQKIDSPLNEVHLDVHIVSTPELQVQTSLARLSGNVDLRLRGTASRPVVLGRVNLLEGMLSFNGTKYRLERGDVTLTNPVRIEPTLDIELSARVRDYDITLGFHGPLNRLTPSYRSDPPLSSSDIISLLALGRTAEEAANPAIMGSAQYSPAVSESASSALVGQALSSTVGSRLQKLFGVSRIKIDPNVSSASNEGLARVTVEQQVSNNLTLTYITSLNQSSQQILQFEYNVNKNVTIQAIRDQTGVVSIDVLFRKRKR